MAWEPSTPDKSRRRFSKEPMTGEIVEPREKLRRHPNKSTNQNTVHDRFSANNYNVYLNLFVFCSL